jgi:hypothetical protein
MVKASKRPVELIKSIVLQGKGITIAGAGNASANGNLGPSVVLIHRDIPSWGVWIYLSFFKDRDGNPDSRVVRLGQVQKGIREVQMASQSRPSPKALQCVYLRLSHCTKRGEADGKRTEQNSGALR